MAMVRRGVWARAEAEADRLIRESLKGVTRHSEKSDILTPWKEQDRLSHEVYVESGIPDASVRRGMYHRAYNRERPDLNSREGLVRSSRMTRSTLGNFAEDHSIYDNYGEND